MECTLYQVILCAALTSTPFLNVLAIFHTTSSTLLCICNRAAYGKSVVRSWMHCVGSVAPVCCSSWNVCHIKIVWNQRWKSLFYFFNCPTRCDLLSLLYLCRQLYMFRVLTPIIRSSYNRNYSFWYWLTGSTTIRSRCWVGNDSCVSYGS